MLTDEDIGLLLLTTNILPIFLIFFLYLVGPNPTYLIVMEFCEKGNLRHVLDSSSKLPWDRKTLMCLDAAQGLYRCQPEDKDLHSISALWFIKIMPLILAFFESNKPVIPKICAVDQYKLQMSASPNAGCIIQKKSSRCMAALLVASF